jgi:hypothetical protein
MTTEAAAKRDVSERSADLEKFAEWVRTVPLEQLYNLLADAQWKGHLWESDLQRFFVLHKYGVDMRDRAPSEAQELVKQLEKAVSAAEYVIGVCEDDLKAGNDPSPFKKSNPSGVMAHCYGAMNFVNGARKALENWKKLQAGRKGK